MLQSFELIFAKIPLPGANRTQLLFANVDLFPVSRLCTGRHGICSKTGKPHVQLSGLHNGHFRTLIAQPYPKNLCRRVATAFQHAIFEFLSRPFMKLLGL